MKYYLAAIFCLFASLAPAIAEERTLTVRDGGESTDASHAEVRGVAAGPFDPALWKAGSLHLLADARHPILSPREGRFRNIYAPSVVQVGKNWHIYYGGWDGEAEGNDHIYLSATRDFLTFGERRTVIDPNIFQHVCNVNVTPAGGGYAMMCTAYPDERGANKPVTFFSPDGIRWNGSDAAGGFPATREQIISMTGYDRWIDADVNGMNVLLFENDTYHIYFSSFRDFGSVWRASGDDGKRFTFESTVLKQRAAVNDVKKLRVGSDAWYLMGLHMNGEQLFYTLSTDPLHFPPSRELLRCAGDDDRHIVAIGWVVAGEQEERGRRVLGLLYGAGAAPSLDRNRLFARWLQKKAVAIVDGKRIEPSASLGPDAQLIRLAGEVRARIHVFAEDGKTLLAASEPLALQPGRAYLLELKSR